MKGFCSLLIAATMLVAGLASADTGVPQVPETQGITTATVIYALGTITEDNAVVWTQSSEELGDPPLSQGESRYTVSYSGDTIMNQGYGEYTAQMILDTGDMVANQYNFETVRQIGFMTGELGYITTDESLLLDGVNSGSSNEGLCVCPFAEGENETVPPYCNIVEMGSSFEGVAVSMLTDTAERHVTETADPGVALRYEVNLGGTGAASAGIRARVLEGRSWTEGEDPEDATDMSYSEATYARGIIHSFHKSMTYESGISRP